MSFFSIRKYIFNLFLWCLVVGFLCLVPQTASWAEEKSADLPPKPSTVMVAYEAETGLLSIQANQAALGKVIQMVIQETNLAVKPLKEELLNEPVSIEFTKIPLEQGVKKLLQGFNAAFLYSPPTATEQVTNRFRLVSVVILGKKDPSQTNPPAEPRVADHRGTIPSRGVDLINAIKANKPIVVRDLVRELKINGTTEEVEGAADVLVETMIASLLAGDAATGHTYYGSLGTLKELAPERAVDPLVHLLQDQTTGRLVHSLAARALGELGQERAVVPLISAFNSQNQDVRNSAAFGLARIGGDSGVGFLLDALRNGDIDRQQSAATALAFWGGARGRTALKNLMAEGQLGDKAIPQSVLKEVISPKISDPSETMPSDKNTGAGNPTNASSSVAK